MKEIKFRAWDKVEKRMFVVKTLNIFADVPVNRGIKYSVSEKGWVCNNETELMQFTGLKDKNGKEIYEGDILQSYPTQDVRFIVVYGQTSESEYGWGLSNKDKHIYSFEKCVQKMEVIGNIYENPKLK